MISAKAYYDQLFQEATAAHQSGDLNKAVTLYKQLTIDMGKQPEPYHRLALIYAQKGQYKEAIPWFEKAVSIHPKHPAYLVNFAETLQRVEQNEDAINLLRKALDIEPGFVEAQQKLGTVLKKTGAFQEATGLFKQIIEKEPKFYPAFFQLGTLMLETGNFKSAKECLNTAVELNPNSIKALNNLAVAYQEWEEFEEAIDCYERALETDPNYIDSIRNLTLIHEKTGDPEKAKAYWLRLSNLKNNDPLVSWKAELIEPVVFSSTKQINQYRTHVIDQIYDIKTKKINLDADQLTKLDIYPPSGLIYHGLDDLEIKKAYGELFKSIPKAQLPTEKNLKPHVGFVVTSGHEGVFVKCMRGLINRLSTDKMNITIVCSFPNGEKIVKPAIENPDINFVSLPKSLGQSVHLLSSLNFDFLHYWEVGTDAYNYFIPYFKPAKVQVTSWGWPTTSGIPTMDYFISCKGLDDDIDQKYYSEKLVLFERLPTYYHSPEIPTLDKTKNDFGIEEDGHLYLCVQNVKKIHPDFDQVVSSILEMDPKGIVAILGDKHAKITEALEQRVKAHCGSHSNRVVVLPRQEKPGYFNILNLADVVLDTLYYNGGANTNGDAFALNKPVVTMPTDFHRGRYTATAYKQMGFEDLIAGNVEEFAALSVRVATDDIFKNLVSQKIADGKHLFFEDKEAVLELENFIEEVTQAKPPQSQKKKSTEPNHTAQDWLKQGLIYKEKKELKQACDALYKAQQLDPTNLEILKRFAELLSNTEKRQDAFIIYQKALELAPNDPEVLNNLGGLLLENRQFEEAILLLKKSIEIDASQNSSFINLGMAYEQISDISSAKTAYSHIKDKLAKHDLFRLHIETLCPNIVMTQEEIDVYRKTVKNALINYDQMMPKELTNSALIRGYAFPSFNHAYHGYNVKEINSLWGEFYAKRIKPVTLGPKNSKPKLGFLVTHGHEEVFIKGGCGLIKNLSVEKFEITVLVNGEAALNKIRNFISREDIHYENFNRDLGIAVQEISALNLDFLYYWEVGSDPLNYFLPFFQLARVQISSWGSPYTSGNPRIQHYWSSKRVENEKYADHYSEKVTLFEPMVFYYYPIQVPEIIKVREDFGFPKDRKVYLCIQTFNKFHPDFDILLKGILEKDPKALIALTMPKHQTIINRLKQRFEQTLGPLSHRILFVEKVPIEDYPQRIALADVCIDTPHYAGVNTTYETLQMGTPVVSLPGEFQRGKYTEAVYRTVGLDEFIPKNNTEYVDLAVRLANEPQLKKELIDTFKKNSHRLFEQQEIVSLVEQFLLDQFGPIDPLLSQNQASALEWLEKGNLHKEHNQLKPAFDALNNARQLDPSNPKILKQFAELLSDIGNNKDAQIAYQKALALSPEDPEILNNLGGLLLENQQFEEAIPLLKKSAQINPNQQSAFVNLGLAYENNGEIEKAKEVYSNINSRLADDDLFKMHIETLCPNIAQSNEEINEYRSKTLKTIQHFDKLVQSILTPEKIDPCYAFPPFSFTYQGRNVKEIKSLWGNFYSKRIQPVTLGPKNEKPKVGFLVTQSHEGVFMKDVGGILKNLSSDKFDLVVLANGHEALKGLKSFVNRNDLTYVSFSKQLGRAVQEIASLNLDFLYYWEIGSDALNYFLPYFQLARIQISSWGSAFTSGNPRVQYYWSSKWLENDDYPDHYSEQVVLFENLPTYYYRSGESAPPHTRKDFDLPESSRIYLCVQSMSKIHPDFDEILLGILEADEMALICLTTPKQDALVEQLMNRLRLSLGAHLDRIRVIKKIPHQQYLQLIKLADVCLDPPHYSGANTTYETLQMGTPVVSLPGEFQRGKYTEAIYRILELEQFIPHNKKEYIELAIKWANDEEAKAVFFESYEKKCSLLFEQQGIIDEIEGFLTSKFSAI